MSTSKLAELRELQHTVDVIREDLGISHPGEVIFFAPCDTLDNELVVVEADGFGGATTMVVEGNYPVDYVSPFERCFASEREAVAAASKIAFRRMPPSQVLGPPL